MNKLEGRKRRKLGGRVGTRSREMSRGGRKEGRDGYVVTGWLDSRVKMDEAACYEILSDRSSGH